MIPTDNVLASREIAFERPAIYIFDPAKIPSEKRNRTLEMPMTTKSYFGRAAVYGLSAAAIGTAFGCWLVASLSTGTGEEERTKLWEMLIAGGSVLFVYVFVVWMLFSLLLRNLRKFPQLLRFFAVVMVIGVATVLVSLVDLVPVGASEPFERLSKNPTVIWLLAIKIAVGVAVLLSIPLSALADRSA